MYEVVLEEQSIKVRNFDEAADLCAALDKLGVDVKYYDEVEEIEDEPVDHSMENFYCGRSIRTI